MCKYCRNEPEIIEENENEIYQVSTIKNPNYKSLMDICSVKVYNEKHFNWVQKIMWRLLLGIKITDVGGEKVKKKCTKL